MNFTNENQRTFFWFGLSFLLVTLLMFLFFKDVNTKLEQTEINNIRLSAKQQQASINGFIAAQAKNIASMSKSLLIISDNQEAIAEYLQILESSLGISSIIFADTSGIGRLSNFKQVDVVDSEAFQSALQGHLHVTAPFQSRFTGKEVLAVGSPIVLDGAVVGVVITEYSLEFINEKITKLVDEADEKGYTVIIDGKGDVVTSTSYKHEYFTPFSNATFQDSITYEALLKNIRLRKPQGGGTVVYVDNEKRILEYRPIALKNWSILVVSEDISDTLIRHISDGIRYLLFAIAISFFIFLAAIIYLKRKGVRDIETVAFYDELTGLPNLVGFKEQIRKILKENPKSSFIMQKMDIKNFKAINEMFGHDTGNVVIKKLAETLRHTNEPTYACARVGADEFFMFAKDTFFNKNEASTTTHEQHFKSLMPELAEHEFSFTYGRSMVKPGEHSVLEMINKTNMAHHMAKKLNDKKVYTYDDSLKKHVLRMAEINNKRKNGIENKEFKVYLQPKMHIIKNTLYGAEALVRWIESDGKMIYPDEFIPLFEKNGFIVHLDMYILQRVCRQIKLWLQAGYSIVPISVNFSRMHLQNPHFVQELKDICDSYGNIRHYIEVELTESAATENMDALSSILNELHEAGFSVSIDDFGAGYSSLGMLKNFTVDALKLDKSFFDKNKDDSRGDVVVKGIIKIARSLGMKIIAEGIETAEQIDFLKSVQCEIVQGYFYAKPMPLIDFEQSYLGDYNVPTK